MKTCILGALLAVALLSGACVPTLHSLFTGQDAAYDPALEGVWRSASATWTLRAYDSKSGRYQLRTEMKDQPPAEWQATLGIIGTNRFLELLPKRPNEIHAKTFYGGHFVQLRSFWKVTLGGDSLTLTAMSAKWLESMLKQGSVNIKHEKPEGGFLFLTASTEELHAFVATYADDPGAFPAGGDEGGITFTRVRETAQPKAEPAADTIP
ncbi:MAG TPA: hypothetical protein PKE12_07870 [Kiritimatiellia bacterium]|nr:hypothetical protein [Kiritimatiellia bacterium]